MQPASMSDEQRFGRSHPLVQSTWKQTRLEHAKKDSTDNKTCEGLRHPLADSDDAYVCR